MKDIDLGSEFECDPDCVSVPAQGWWCRQCGDFRGVDDTDLCAGCRTVPRRASEGAAMTALAPLVPLADALAELEQSALLLLLAEPEGALRDAARERLAWAVAMVQSAADW